MTPFERLRSLLFAPAGRSANARYIVILSAAVSFAGCPAPARGLLWAAFDRGTVRGCFGRGKVRRTPATSGDRFLLCPDHVD